MADKPTTRRLEAALVEGAGSVWLVRECPEHGSIVTLYEEDAELLDYLEQWTAPTKPPTPDSPENTDPIPECYAHGLGAQQIQHTCLLLEDITEACNLRCPTCFAGSSPQLTGVAPATEVIANVDRRLHLEGGRLDVLMISGGEPTLHPDLLPLLEELFSRDITRIILNTNGVLVARDDRLLDFLARNRSRLELYLQFDGFDEATYHYHRGADLRGLKQRAVERLTSAGVFTTLTMTAALGVNDHEIGAVARYALDTPFIGGVAIQPVFDSGRLERIDPCDRLTNTGVLRRLGPQTGGIVEARDLIALPCSHPHCASVGYMVQGEVGEWSSIVRLLGHDRLLDQLGLVSGCIVQPELDADLRVLVKDSLHGLFSERSSLTHPKLGDLFEVVLRRCDVGVTTLLRLAGRAVRDPEALRKLAGTRVKRINVKPFMDIHTMIEERLVQCCVHVGTVGDRHQCVPFCAAQAWPDLGTMKLAATAPHQPSLRPAVHGL
ncbi:radical SAM protein [Actinomycetota bacterium]